MISREEAIKRLDGMKYWVSFHNGSYREELEAIDIAISDMQKQIPKPVQGDPLNHDVKINNCTFRKGTRILAICPSCGEWVNKHHKYCSECGQAIDWGEEE